MKEYCGRPWLWARHDRKPNKAAEKRFRKFQQENPGLLSHGEDCDAVTDEPRFHWDVEKDLKVIPAEWIPSVDATSKDSNIVPDINGHVMGWVPIDPNSRQHCWHLSVVDLNNELALVLGPRSESLNQLELTLQPLSELLECTLELIGTNINGNPYKLGTKQNPFHILVRHGVIPFNAPLPLNFGDLKDWFETNLEGGVEGIVWHCSGGRMYKLHRHHMKLDWPVQRPRLLSCSVNININCGNGDYGSSLICNVCKLHGKTFSSLEDLTFESV